MDIGKYRERIKELQDYLLINNSTGYYPNICNELMEELNIVLNELEKKDRVINEIKKDIERNIYLAESNYEIEELNDYARGMYDTYINMRKNILQIKPKM